MDYNNLLLDIIIIRININAININPSCPVYNIKITILLQGANAVTSQEDWVELVSKFLPTELCRCKRRPRSVLSDSF